MYSQMKPQLQEQRRKYEPCGEVHLGTGRELGESLVFIVDYPLDLDVQYSIAATYLQRFVELGAEKCQELAGKISPLSRAQW